MTPRVVLQPRKARPFYGRHPWVYPGAIARVEGDPADGAEVDLLAHTGNFVARGLSPTFILSTDDCRGDYERLVAQGVEFTEEPTERFYGIDCGLRDPFGNHIRMTEPAPEPIVPPSTSSASNAGT